MKEILKVLLRGAYVTFAPVFLIIFIIGFVGAILVSVVINGIIWLVIGGERKEICGTYVMAMSDFVDKIEETISFP